mmetsp:Transcript_10558/g.14454  ORF Transcript_10558/g.14454 Transcript_10558/m.14454 type:complete len:407 (-) Transcript_10558:19-1239(-)
MSDSEEDVVLKDDDGFGEQVDLDDFSFISTEAPTNEKEGNIYDQSDHENGKQPSKSQDGTSASPDEKKSKLKKRDRSPSPSGHNKQIRDKNRRLLSSDSESEHDNHTQHNNNRPPVPEVTPESEVHVNMEEIKSFQGKKAGFAEYILNAAPQTQLHSINPYIDPTSFNPAHVTANPSTSAVQERYKDYSTSAQKKDLPPREARPMERPMQSRPPMQYQMRNTPVQPNPMTIPNYNQPPLHVEGAPPIPGVNLTKQQFDEMFANRYKVNPNNNTKPRENRQIREPNLQTANPLAPKVPDEIILEEQKRVDLKIEVSKTVVSALNKYLKEGKIANKDDFKHLSRKLTHKLMMKEQGIKHTTSEKRTKAITKFIDNWFRKKGGSYVRKSKPWEKPSSVVNFVPPLHPGM